MWVELSQVIGACNPGVPFLSKYSNQSAVTSEANSVPTTMDCALEMKQLWVTFVRNPILSVWVSGLCAYRQDWAT